MIDNLSALPVFMSLCGIIPFSLPLSIQTLLCVVPGHCLQSLAFFLVVMFDFEHLNVIYLMFPVVPVFHFVFGIFELGLKCCRIGKMILH